MKRKILMISYTALMASSPNGRTMKSLVQGISADDISLFCCSGVPDTGSCGSCYKLSNIVALKSLYSRSAVGSVIDMQASRQTTGGVSAEDQRKGRKSAWKYLAKELVWAIKGWKNRHFKNWLNEQQFDCVVYMYGDQAALQNLAVYVARKRRVPLIVYSCEDYCLKDYNYIDGKGLSFPFRCYQSLSKRATKRLFSQADALITNSEELGEAYRQKYGITNMKTVMMASQMECIPNGKVRSIEDIHVDFLGALGHYRIKALIEIGNALQKIDSRLKLNVYGKINNEQFRTMLDDCDGITYRGFVSYETVQEVMRSSALLIEAISDTPYIRKSKRYGFSTKYADSFACGTPFFVYAPDTMIETVFAQKHGCAFVATSKEELVEVLQSALFDEEMRQNKLKSAKQVTEEYFNRTKNIDAVNSLIEELLHH